MASWAKNQIAKQLARFAKNVDPSQISLKFLKGEGELNNLELDEAVLSDLLELPPWLQLTKVTCNRISAKVPWTSLKTDPIRLLLDCVEVEIIATETARQTAANVPVFSQKASSKPNKYGFVEKVVDGMYLSINSVMASFKSTGFKASVSASRVVVQSTTPEWRRTDNMRQTRIKDDQRGEVLTFKEIRWGTMRFDADASYRPESRELPSTPLRLITNNSAVRLVIKKRLTDCSMLSSKLAVVLDDILWVLTQSQLLKLSSFVHYLIELRNQFFIPTAQQKHSSSGSSSHPTPPLQGVGHGSGLNPLFSLYDISETSLQLRTHRVDLHLCDDSTLDGDPNGRKERGANDDLAAALQISLIGVALDHCPYHIAETKRTVVKSDDEVAIQRKQWAHQLIENFKSTDRKHLTTPSGAPSRSPGSRASPSETTLRRPSRPVLYESFFIGSLQNFYIMQVTNSKTVEHQTFLSSEKESLFLPKEMPAASVDHTTYYFMGEHADLPVPAPNVFVQVNPIKLTFDPVTCIWLNRFAQSVISGLAWTRDFIQRDPGFFDHVDLRLEALLPKIVIPLLLKEEALTHKEDRPRAVQVQISQAVVSNCRVGGQCSQADLMNDLPDFVNSRSYTDLTCFPNLPTDLSPHPNRIWLNDYSVNYQQLQNLTKRDPGLVARLQRDNSMPREIWCIWCDQMWIDFLGVEKAGGRPISFVDAVPVRLWMCQEVAYTPAEAAPLSPTPSESSVEAAESATEDIGEECEDRVSAQSWHGGTKLANGHVRRRSTGSTSSELADVPVRCENVPSLTFALQTSNGAPFSPDACANADNHRPNAVVTDLSMKMSHSDSALCSKTVLGGIYVTSVHDLVLPVKEFPSVDYACGGPPPPFSSPADVRGSSSLAGLHSSSAALLSRPIEPLQKEDCFPERKPEPSNSSSMRLRAASLAVLLCIPKSLQIQLDHFQLLFLLRAMEMLGGMTTKIKEDSVQASDSLSPYQDGQRKESMILNISFPGAIVDLVLPPCIGIDDIQQLSWSDRVKLGACHKGDSAALTEEFLRANSSPAVRLPRKGVPALHETASKNIADPCKAGPYDTDKFESGEVNDITIDSLNSRRGISGLVGARDGEIQREACPDFFEEVECVKAGISSAFYKCQPELLVVFGNSSGEPERSMSAEISNFDPAGHSGLTLHDLSKKSSSTNTVQIELVDSGVQVGNLPVFESRRAEDELVSIVRVRAGGVLVGVNSVGDDSSVKVVANTLTVTELGNMKYGKVLDPRGSLVEAHDGAGSIANVADATSFSRTSALRLRLESGPKAEVLASGAGELGYAHIKVDSLKAALLMSSLDNLSEFAEDEFVLPTMPFLVELTNADVSLYDDRPRRYLSAIRMPPLQLVISDLTISRDVHGMITLRHGTQVAASFYEQNVAQGSGDTLIDDGRDREGSLPCQESRCRDGAVSNGSMVSSQGTLGRHAVLSENSRLVEDLEMLNARVSGLHCERDALIKVIDKLQQELMWSNREVDELHQRMRSMTLAAIAHRGERF